jgi:hypothetical protein
MTEACLARGRVGHRQRQKFLLVLLSLLACLAIPAVNLAAASGPAKAHKASGNPLNGRGAWIWYVSHANGGRLSSIVATAHRYGVTTLMIKAGDGSSAWSQFSSGLLHYMHTRGLHVCAWQFVYGSHPAAEARIGAAAAHRGADCLLIDAEGQYEGKYVSAQTYMRNVRRSVGKSYPIGLASFPYVDYHPGFPYSVFLGPGGAQYNAPQMYWRDIGTSVDSVYSHTYGFNRPYSRTLAPLGEVTGPPPQSQIRRFRQLSRAYGAHGVSWWEWAEATRGSWHALSQPVGSPSNFRPRGSMAALGRGAQGDLVVWAQEHLVGAGQSVRIDGSFGASTQRAARRFQSAHGISATGTIGTKTWNALLRYQAHAVRWTSGGARLARRGAADGAGAVGGLTPVPKSASLPAKAYEIPPTLGQG